MNDVVAPAVSVKIEHCSSSSPSSSRATVDSNHSNHLGSWHGDESVSYGSSAKSTSGTKSHHKSGGTRLPDNACCSHAAIRLVKSHCASPRSVDVRKRRSRSRSRSPTSNLARSRSHHSRHSVDIKTERITPTLHKKSSRYDKITSLHCALSLAVQCIVIGPVCGFVCVCLCLCGSVTTITRNCVHRSSPN